MTDKGKGLETPVKIFMSNDDELQPGHTAHGASVVVVAWILQDHCLAYLWPGPGHCVFFLQYPILGMNSVSSKYGEWRNCCIYDRMVGGQRGRMFMFNDLEIQKHFILYHYVSLKENQTRTSLPLSSVCVIFGWFFVPMNWWFHSASVRGELYLPKLAGRETEGSWRI